MKSGAERTSPTGDRARPPHAESGGQDQGTRFRKTLVRVLLVQVMTLAVLWLMQATYHS